jgi:hypothetical protein
MPMKLNPELMGEIAGMAIRAERFFLRCQFDAECKAEADWAEAGRRHAKGILKIVEELPAPTETSTQAP